jgi:hypothetical protein
VRFVQHAEPQIEKPLMIAAMQDMGNTGGIVVYFINTAKDSVLFRSAESVFHPYVLDKGGYIEIPKDVWEYRYSKNLIVFGGGNGQPQTNEIHDLCQDVINVAKSILQNSSILWVVFIRKEF